MNSTKQKSLLLILGLAGALSLGACTRNTDGNGGVGMNPSGTTTQSGDLGNKGQTGESGTQPGATENMPETTSANTQGTTSEGGTTADSHCPPGANAADCPTKTGPGNPTGTGTTNSGTTGGSQ